MNNNLSIYSALFPYKKLSKAHHKKKAHQIYKVFYLLIFYLLFTYLFI